MVTAHLGLAGHPLVHAAIVLPGLVLAGSLLWMAFGLGRAWLTMRSELRRAVGRGPLGSAIIQHRDIVVGVTGLGRSRIIVSDTALAAMDPQELEASLSHELGHIKRRHRPLLLVSSVLAALSRSLPGTRTAAQELRLCLERDADEYAVAQTRDPLALASAICKAASGAAPVGATGGGGRVVLRLAYLQGASATRGAPTRARDAIAGRTVSDLGRSVDTGPAELGDGRASDRRPDRHRLSLRRQVKP